MLYILTGNIQIGKTRWLQTLVGQLESEGVPVTGVLAPGRWIAHEASVPGDAQTFQKTGIDNELLPSHELVPFAKAAGATESADAAQGARAAASKRAEGAPDQSADSCKQSRAAKLSWDISDAAIAKVNAHLESLLATAGDNRATKDERPGLLVIDELGRLELAFGKGLTAALQLVDRGATAAYPHALIVVREQLLQEALARFANTNWGGMQPVSPTEEIALAIRQALASQ